MNITKEELIFLDTIYHKANTVYKKQEGKFLDKIERNNKKIQRIESLLSIKDDNVIVPDEIYEEIKLS